MTLPAVDVATATAPLGLVGAVLPAALLGGFLVSISRVRPPVGDLKNSELGDSELVRRWALGHLAMGLEVLTIPLMFGVLTSPQAVLYYWTSSMWAGLGASKLLERQMTAEPRRVLTPEAQGLLQRAATKVAAGSHEEALGYLKQARIVAPRHPSVHMALGDVLASLPGKNSAAATAYRNAIAEAQRSGRLHVADYAALSQRATFALGMLLARLSGDDDEKHDKHKEEALKLLERAAARVNDGDAFKAVAVRALLAIAAISDDEGRRREALAAAKSADADVEARLSRTKAKKAKIAKAKKTKAKTKTG